MLSAREYALIHALIERPGEDQVTLAGRVAFDAATSGSVIGRLEAKGLIRRAADAADKRRKLLWVTPLGEQLAQQMKRTVRRVQNRIVDGLDRAEREQLIALLHKLVLHADDAP